MKTDFVAFVDILGFAGTVEALDRIAFASVVDYWTKGVVPRVNSHAYSLANIYEIWTRQFDNWQRIVGVDKNRRGARFEIHSFLFSDSGFVASQSLVNIIDFCRWFLRSMITSQVPVRAGIGAGTFASFDINTRRTASGDFLVRCPFAGSAVVRAYRAESSGLRGLRCFVHPSAIQAATRGKLLKHFIPLPAQEMSDSASHELDLFAPGMDEIDPGLDELLKGVTDMEHVAGPRFAEYYENTRAAIQRMAEQHDFIA
jgi:hypothetical protein